MTVLIKTSFIYLFHYFIARKIMISVIITARQHVIVGLSAEELFFHTFQCTDKNFAFCNKKPTLSHDDESLETGTPRSEIVENNRIAVEMLP